MQIFTIGFVVDNGQMHVQYLLLCFQAAVKAFGVLGDIETAFQLADECPSSETDAFLLSSLLIACNSHKEAGFQLAISVSDPTLYLSNRQDCQGGSLSNSV